MADWLGVLPFLLFCLVFEIIPIFIMTRDSLLDKAGNLTLAHYSALGIPLYINSFLNSIKLSGVTALLGTSLGCMIGYAIYRWPSDRAREALTSLSDVTTNFAGAPLAFAFIIVLGSTGIVTQFFKQYLDIKLYPAFSIYSFTGLVMAYVYFQLPLMVLLIIPAFNGLRKEWMEFGPEPGRQYAPVLVGDRAAGVDPVAGGRAGAAVRQRLRRLCHRLYPDRLQPVVGDHPDRLHHHRRGAARAGGRVGDGRGLAGHHGFVHRHLSMVDRRARRWSKQ